MDKKQRNENKNNNKSKGEVKNENIDLKSKTYAINGYNVSLVFLDTGMTLDNIVESYIEEKLFVF
ncbi:MAG: hypothetical protein ACTHWZ_08715 [Peptoniphilaceae bacterium]